MKRFWNHKHTGRTILKFVGSVNFGALTLLALGCAVRATHNNTPLVNTAGVDKFIASISIIKKSICPVVCISVGQDSNATLNSIEGTGFFVSADGTFVTAKHVIDGIMGPRQPPIKPCPLSAIYLPVDNWEHESLKWFAFRPGECVTIQNFDIASCRPLAPISVGFTPVTFEDGDQLSGTAVAFTGFGLQSLDPITSRGDVAAYVNRVAELGKTEMLIDRTAWPGDSGSPVYLEDGRVIGMIQRRGTGDGEGVAVVRPTRFIERLLPNGQQGH